MHNDVGMLDLLYVERTKNFNLVEPLVMGDSYMDFVFCHSKVFKLQALLLDAAGAMQSHSGKCHGYFYMIRRGPNCFLLCHVTGLIFCLQVKPSLPIIFNCVDS